MRRTISALFLTMAVSGFGQDLAWKRVAAELIDWGVGFGVGYGVTSGLMVVAGADRVLEKPLRFFLVNEAGVTLPSLIIVALSDWGGGSVGKKLLGIEVRQQGSETLRWETAFLRSWLELTPMELSHVGHAFTFTREPKPNVALAAYSAGLLALIVKLTVPFFTGGEIGWVDGLFQTRVVPHKAANTED